jgi:hypothetical protein
VSTTRVFGFSCRQRGRLVKKLCANLSVDYLAVWPAVHVGLLQQDAVSGEPVHMANPCVRSHSATLSGNMQSWYGPPTVSSSSVKTTCPSVAR